MKNIYLHRMSHRMVINRTASRLVSMVIDSGARAGGHNQMSSNETSNGPAKIRSHGHDSYYFCTSWVSAFVAVPKAHGEVRVWVDICAGPMKLSFVNATHPHTGRDTARPQWGNSFLQARPTLDLPLN